MFLIFYEPPTTDLQKPYAYLTVHMESTGETVTYSGKFDENGEFINLTSMLYDKEGQDHTLCTYLSDNNDETIVFRLSEDNVKASAGLTKTTDVDEVLKIALSGKVPEAREKMIELIKVYGMSESDFLKYLNSAVFKSKHDKLSDILEIIAKYDYRILVGSNSEIQLSAMLAELAKVEN